MIDDAFDQKIDKMTEDELVREIERHNELYWRRGEPEITDQQYDALVRRLESLNPPHELIQQVQAPAVAGEGKVRHINPMLSLDKAYSLEDVMTWAGKYVRSTSRFHLERLSLRNQR